MLEINQRLEKAASPSITLTLPFDQRQKSRLRVTLDNGSEAALILDRGVVLCHGDCLLATNGQIVEVRAAEESVSTVREPNAHLISRACYHLGNRHVPLQIGEGWLRYQHDHVLDDMVRSLGLSIEHEKAPFQPEPGAYGKHSSNQHTHSHEH
ncbi:MAG: urease accessory protein UreE [Nitrospinota bacterium]|nr:urease accessory protein UreE [Nitrospinota bacterium]